jgi:hypothetical protein
LHKPDDKILATKAEAWHVEYMGVMRDTHNILVEKPEGKRPVGRRKHRWKIILEWILGKLAGKVRTACIYLRIGLVAGSCEQSNENLVSIKGG